MRDMLQLPVLLTALVIWLGAVVFLLCVVVIAGQAPASDTRPVPVIAPAAPEPGPRPEACAWRAVEPLSAAVPATGVLQLGASAGRGDARYDARRAAWTLPAGSGLVLRLPRAGGEALRAVRVHIEDAPGGTALAALALWRGGVPEIAAEEATDGSGFYQVLELRAGDDVSAVSGAAPRALGLVLERPADGAGPALVRGVDALVCTEASTGPRAKRRASRVRY